MRFIDLLCPPALLYLLYIVVHIGLDLSFGMWATAVMKVIMGLAGVIILDALCSVDLGVVSWAIVATPFIMVALATSISLGLGIDRQAAKIVKEGFSGLTYDNSKNRDKVVTTLKDDAGALPLSQDSTY
uniref:Uncharacterized protein n=1 Tax=viral metagenome TaxID=1070528 RepID=A0A6C0CHM5_9ZZZZ